jgi:putative SOS response-associated peptidase YedK
MCGRYRRTTAEEEIAKQYHVAIPSQLDLPISYNIAPSQNILAIREDRRPQIRRVSLGFDPKLVEGRKDRVQDDQREGRDHRHHTGCQMPN